MKKSIWALAAAAVGALALTAAGCGSGSNDEPTKVDVKVTEQGKGQYTVQVPKQIEGGAVDLTLNNASNQAPHSAQLIQLQGGHTYAEAAPIINSERPQQIPDWIRAYGGIGQVPPARPGRAPSSWTRATTSWRTTPRTARSSPRTRSST